MTTALILRDSQLERVEITPAAHALNEAALDQAARITRVTNAEENAAATAAQVALKVVSAGIETARKEAKRPHLDYNNLIDATAAKFIEDNQAEFKRIGRLAGNWQAMEDAKARDAERARQAELTRLEQERQAELNKAASLKEREVIHEKFAERAQVEAPPPAPREKPKGQRINKGWEITIFDLHALYRSHPNCVKLEALLTPIGELVNNGIIPQGVRAVPKTDATVTLPREQKALEI